ncbi:conserved hypothetical protein [uncultured Mycobacterium sp.]|uniref:DNA-binding phage zinc finger domain-containing protein n=1 Tax=uncultured Mycobacterium sp. TaxID=171292 RepID=A0A1Y5P583_9MYCO|nr:conserved hypothetical protein [uncultured Mycobacterium sp.]
MSAKTSKLTNPNNAAVRKALRIVCPSCGAKPGERCTRIGKRIVHFARCELREVL